MCLVCVYMCERQRSMCMYDMCLVCVYTCVKGRGECTCMYMCVLYTYTHVEGRGRCSILLYPLEIGSPSDPGPKLATSKSQPASRFRPHIVLGLRVHILCGCWRFELSSDARAVRVLTSPGPSLQSLRRIFKCGDPFRTCGNTHHINYIQDP